VLGIRGADDGFGWARKSYKIQHIHQARKLIANYVLLDSSFKKIKRIIK
jgi:hypothetical protein